MPKTCHDADGGLAQIRNIGIIAHIDAGKTTLTERFLFHSGMTHRVGEIDDGTTVMDYLDEERERGITIVSAAASFQWNSNLVHLIDTPGHIDFTAEVERSLRVIDGVVVVFSAVEGVEAQSEKVWRQSEKYHTPKIAFINKLDRLGASFERTLDDIRHKFDAVKPLPIQLPTGAESELDGVIDLVEMRLLRFIGENGAEILSETIPDSLAGAAKAAREELAIAVAEISDEAATIYLEGGYVPPPLLRMGLRNLTLSGKVVPVLCGSAKRNIGVQPILDAVDFYLPSPLDRKTIHATDPKLGTAIQLDVSDKDFAGLVFKVIAGGSSDLLYLRTYSGILRIDDTVLNIRTKEHFKIKRILRLLAKNAEPLPHVGPGDIVGLIAAREASTGDTLCSPTRPLALEPISFPEPVISMAVEPKSSKDKDKLDAALSMLIREDPTLSIRIDENTGQNILSGMGELHLEIKCHTLRDTHHIDIRAGAPQVMYRETILESGSFTGVLSRILADKEIWAEVDFRLVPAPKLDGGLKVDLDLDKRVKTPKAWAEAACDALVNGLKTGGNWGYPLIYIQGTITAIRGTPDKTHEGAVAGAVHEGLVKALRQGTAILEPLAKIEITGPDSCVGEIARYLQSRRALIHAIEHLPSARRLLCEIPLAEMFGFSKALPKLSGGRAFHTMEPCGFQQLSESDMTRFRTS